MYFLVDWQNRVELIQDFQFAEASYRLRMTPDGQYMIATGTYKPQFRVYELSQMAMKFERHTDCENVQMEVQKTCVLNYQSLNFLIDLIG